jgi:hypothetical protein
MIYCNQSTATAEDIKKRYKQLSLCMRLLLLVYMYQPPVSTVIHPDKATHPKAQDAFDLLKKVSLCLILRISLTHNSRQKATCQTRKSAKTLTVL